MISTLHQLNMPKVKKSLSETPKKTSVRLKKPKEPKPENGNDNEPQEQSVPSKSTPTQIPTRSKLSPDIVPDTSSQHPKYSFEHAKSGRAKCKICKETIALHSIKLAVLVRISDHESYISYHPSCASQKILMNIRNEFGKLENTPGWDDLDVDVRSSLVDRMAHSSPKKKERIKISHSSSSD